MTLQSNVVHTFTVWLIDLIILPRTGQELWEKLNVEKSEINKATTDGREHHRVHN